MYVIPQWYGIEADVGQYPPGRGPKAAPQQDPDPNSGGVNVTLRLVECFSTNTTVSKTDPATATKIRLLRAISR